MGFSVNYTSQPNNNNFILSYQKLSGCSIQKISFYVLILRSAANNHVQIASQCTSYKHIGFTALPSLNPAPANAIVQLQITLPQNITPSAVKLLYFKSFHVVTLTSTWELISSIDVVTNSFYSFNLTNNYLNNVKEVCLLGIVLDTFYLSPPYIYLSTNSLT